MAQSLMNACLRRRLCALQNEYAGGRKCAKAIKLTKYTDFSKMRVAQMKEILRDRGIVCRECAEKRDFVAKLKGLVQTS